MTICFYGVGGVGGYFGSLIAQRFNSVHDIYFVARGKHKESICTNGITLKKSGGAEIINIIPKTCTDNISDLPICNLVVLSVKSYDLENAVKDINKITNKDSIILPLLNGVDIYDKVRKYVKTAIVLPSCVYIGTHIESPGVISQNGGNGKILIGCDPLYPDFYPESLLTVLKESKIDFSWEDNVQVSIWSKFMFIAAYGLVTATYEKTLGEILEDSELSQTTKSIMTEIKQIANRLNVPLNPDIAETSFLKGKQFPFDAKTSFQRDIELKGKINEADIFGGTIIRFGEEFGINVSNTKKIQEKLMSKFE
jgi:2-dehydropantoate 2-reductase